MKNRHSLEGKIVGIGEVTNIQTKSGKNFPKRSLRVDLTPMDMATGTRSQYDNIAELEIGGDTLCEKLDGFKVGDEIAVTFEVRGISYTDKSGIQRCFTKIHPWAISAVSKEAAASVPAPAPEPVSEELDDGLPF